MNQLHFFCSVQKKCPPSNKSNHHFYSNAWLFKMNYQNKKQKHHQFYQTLLFSMNYVSHNRNFSPFTICMNILFEFSGCTICLKTEKCSMKIGIKEQQFHHSHATAYHTHSPTAKSTMMSCFVVNSFLYLISFAMLAYVPITEEQQLIWMIMDIWKNGIFYTL